MPSLDKPENGAPDVVALAGAAEAAQSAVAAAEAAALRAEAAHSARGRGSMSRAGRSPRPSAASSRLEAEAKALAKLIDVEAKKLWPPAIDLLTVEKGFEAALGAALGDDLEAPVDPASPIRWAGAAADAADPALPGGRRAARAPCHGAARACAPARADRRGRSRARGRRSSRSCKPGQRLVSPEGDLWRWDGFAAASNAPTAAARRLAAKNRLADLDAELAHARTDADGKRRAVEAAEAELAAAVAAEGEARNARREAQAQAEAARDAHAAAEREANRLTARLSALAEAKVRLAASRDETLAAKRDATQAIEAARLGGRAGKSARRIARRGRAPSAPCWRKRAAKRRRSRARPSCAQGASRRSRPKRAEWDGAQGGAASQIATLGAALRRSAGRARLARRRAGGVRRAAPRADQRGRGGRSRAARSLRPPRRRRDRARRGRQGGARRARGDGRSAHRAGARRGAARGRQAAAPPTSRTKSARCWRPSPRNVAALAEIAPGAALPEVAAVEERLDKLRRDRERLGAVNLRAEEELREVEAQHGSLVTERDDLTEAIKRLRQGIQSLNREARERLLSSFAVVNGHFQRLFTSLFGGGTAELQLVESDDPLEAGLDILAKPPGKKPATLSLLSGGEQALTAMALIFAVFLTNPAPICVLDEVDAPLDDHNVDRFCDLLDEMTRLTDTRFVIITHNPITMARMNRLFGVTMAERGISQLVSVDLETAAKIREAV